MSQQSAAKDYDKSHGQMDRGRQVAGDVAPHLVQGPVLEVGIGTGLVAAGLRELGHRVYGVDNSPDMLKGAFERLGPTLALGDAHALPIADASVGNAVYIHVFHLLDDMPRALGEAARVIRPGGRLVAIHGVPVPDEDDVTEAVVAMKPIMKLTDEAEFLDPAAQAQGFRLLSRQYASPFAGDMSPNQYADSIVKRVWGYLRNVSDETWQTHVEPAIEALRQLPDPDRKRPQQWRVPLAVYERV